MFLSLARCAVPGAPHGFAGVTMYAGPDRRSLAFFLDVVAAISDEGPSMATGHHVGRGHRRGKSRRCVRIGRGSGVRR